MNPAKVAVQFTGGFLFAVAAAGAIALIFVTYPLRGRR